MDKGKQLNISSRLHELIYNPIIPTTWRKIPTNLRLRIFHGLFLLLNVDFQMKCAQELDLWLALRIIHEEAEPILTKQEGKEILQHPLLTDDELNSDISILSGAYEARIFELQDSTSEANDCNSPIGYQDLCDVLLRKDEPYWLFKTGQILELESIRVVSHFHKPLLKSIILESPLFENIHESVNARGFAAFVEEREKGHVPPLIFAAVSIAAPKELLLRDFENYVDDMQGRYFKQNPNEESPGLGHSERKLDGRKKSYPLDEFERYYKAYVLKCLGKKHREIARELFPKEEISNSESKITQAVRRARNLIKNAVTVNFPGKYT